MPKCDLVGMIHMIRIRKRIMLTSVALSSSVLLNWAISPQTRWLTGPRSAKINKKTFLLNSVSRSAMYSLLFKKWQNSTLYTVISYTLHTTQKMTKFYFIHNNILHTTHYILHTTYYILTFLCNVDKIFVVHKPYVRSGLSVAHIIVHCYHCKISSYIPSLSTVTTFLGINSVI